ncbi:hypothetical protein SNEBB_004376 [Seison nebaliae]|nr:hypothetical protein SNEBB_004376 [Seison nebaliae]
MDALLIKFDRMLFNKGQDLSTDELVSNRMKEILLMTTSRSKFEMTMSTMMSGNSMKCLEMLTEMHPDEFRKKFRSNLTSTERFRNAIRTVLIFVKFSLCARRYFLDRYLLPGTEEDIRLDFEEMSIMQHNGLEQLRLTAGHLDKNVLHSLLLLPQKRRDDDYRTIYNYINNLRDFRAIFESSIIYDVAKTISYERYDHGRVLVWQNKRPEMIYYLISGRIRLIRQLSSTCSYKVYGEIDRPQLLFSDFFTNNIEDTTDYIYVTKGLIELLVLEGDEFNNFFKQTISNPSRFISQSSLLSKFPLADLDAKDIFMKYFHSGEIIVNNAYASPFVFYVKSGSANVFRKQFVLNTKNEKLKNVDEYVRILNSSQKDCRQHLTELKRRRKKSKVTLLGGNDNTKKMEEKPKTSGQKTLKSSLIKLPQITAEKKKQMFDVKESLVLIERLETGQIFGLEDLNERKMKNKQWRKNHYLIMSCASEIIFIRKRVIRHTDNFQLSIQLKNHAKQYLDERTSENNLIEKIRKMNNEELSSSNQFSNKHDLRTIINSDNHDNNTNDNENDTQPIDRGRAWFVLLGAFVTSFFGIGFYKAFPIVFNHLIVDFNSTVQSVSIVTALSSSISALTGPVAAMAADRFTERNVSLFGAFLMTISYSLNYFVIYFHLFYITFFFHGIGMGLVFTSTFSMLNKSFTKRRMLANGLATTGDALASLVMPLMNYWLIREFTIHGYFLIFGGMLSHLIFCSFLLKSTISESIPIERPSSFDIQLSISRKRSLSVQRLRNESVVLGISGGLDLLPKSNNGLTRSRSHIVDHSTDDHLIEKYHKNSCTLVTFMEPDNNSTTINVDENTTLTNANKTTRSSTNNTNKRWNRFMPSKILYQITDTQFSFFLLIRSFAAIALAGSGMGIVAYAIDERKLSEIDAIWLLNIGGITEIVMKIILSLLLDDLKHYEYIILIFGYLSSALTLFFLVYCTTFLTICLCFVVFRCSVSIWLTIGMTVLADMSSSEMMNTTVGLSSLAMGLSLLIGLPIFGFIHDLFHSYRYSFWFGSSGCGLASLLSCIYAMKYTS